MKLFRSLLVLTGTTLVMTALIVAVPASARGFRLSIGIVQGSVTMSPLCPTEPCTVVGNPYENYKVTLSSSNGMHYTFPIRRNGGFSGFVLPGAYTIDITPNHWQPVCSAEGICRGAMGSANVPADFNVQKNQINSFDIVIDTGML